MRIQLKYVVASLVATSSFILFAGNWTLNTTTKILTSEDGYWSLTNCSVSGSTLTLGKVLTAAADGVLDFRSTKVNGTSITTLGFNRVSGVFSTAPIREFYCDKFDRIENSLFKNNTTLEKVVVTTSGSARTAFASAFEGCVNLKEVSLPQPLTGHYEKIFSGCQNLDMDIADLFAPSSGGVGKSSYAGCAKLHGKLVLDSISGGSSLPTDAFSGSGIEELVITSPNLLGIVNGPFKSCTSLTNVTIACPNLTSFSSTSNPFSGCTNLRRVTFDCPNLNSINTSTSYAHFFANCSSISEVIFKNPPWKNSDGGDIMRTWLNKHVLCNVSAVAATVDAPKNCTIYALRSDYKPYASAMTGDYEKMYAPKRCYGVYCSGSSRLAYMAQPPDYKSGMFVSVQ